MFTNKDSSYIPAIYRSTLYIKLQCATWANYKSQEILYFIFHVDRTQHMSIYLTSSWRTRTLFTENRGQINLAMYSNRK